MDFFCSSVVECSSFFMSVLILDLYVFCNVRLVRWNSSTLDYINGYSDTRSVQENFDLLTSFIQDSADKHIPSKTSRSVS